MRMAFGDNPITYEIATPHLRGTRDGSQWKAKSIVDLTRAPRFVEIASGV
jgi:hypothetical protein